MVWVVDPQLRAVTSYRSAKEVKMYARTDQLKGEEIVQGFRCPVADVSISN